ncbi:MAG TPA: DnaB-like helicase C-terminal domain-containing protein [Pyrinomonadaceae bacterium]
MNELPNNTESEVIVIGRIFLDPSLLPKVKQDLTPERMYTHAHKKIFSAMLDLYERDEPITPTAVYEVLRDPAIPVSYITNLASPSNAPGFVPIEPEVKRIVSSSRKRAIVKFAELLKEKALEDIKTEDELIGYASTWIDNAKTKLPHSNVSQALSQMVEDQAERYRKWHKGISDAIPTGFDLIDDHLMGGGLVRSGLYVLAARPSMGKSSLALDIAANVAQTGKVVHVVSREMPAPSLFDRLHAAHAGVARWKLRKGIYQKEYNRLLETLERVARIPIILDNASLSVSDIRADMREWERRNLRADLLIVDYIQLLEGKGRSRNDEVGSITRALKGLGMEFQIPILGLSQLTRDNDRQKREPELSDLRDSGEIEQDADAVFFLFGERQEEGAKIYSRWFKCAKQRDGELFRVEMTFNGELVTFRSFEQLAMQGIHDHTEATQ